MTEAFSVRLTFEKRWETKGTWRFRELDIAGCPAEEPIVGTLYIKKVAITGEVPELLDVTINASTE
jgi:hypothetical protein